MTVTKTEQVPFLKIIKDYWHILAFIVALIVGYTDLKSDASYALRQSNDNFQWTQDWERGGSLPVDEKQNSRLDNVEGRIDKIDSLDLPARLTAIEVNQQNIQATLLEIKNAVIN